MTQTKSEKSLICYTKNKGTPTILNEYFGSNNKNQEQKTEKLNKNYNQSEMKSSGPNNRPSEITAAEKKKSLLVPGISGIKNIGNTCYFNATIQALSNTPYFNAYLINFGFEQSLKKNKQVEIRQKLKNENALINNNDLLKECENTISWQLAKLIKALWREPSKITSKTLKELVGKYNSEFIGWGQNDSQELLNTILDRFHEETKKNVLMTFPLSKKKNGNVFKLIAIRKNVRNIIDDVNISKIEKKEFIEKYKQFKNENANAVTTLTACISWKKFVGSSYSIITKLFTGLFYSTVTCKVCKYKSEIFEPFNNLQIETKDSGETTLEECLKQYSSIEELTGDEQYNCPICETRRDAVKEIRIWQPPKYLIIQLKRFKNNIFSYGNYSNSRLTKTHSVVKFPIKDLNLNDNLCELNHKEINYNLYAVTEHTGSVYGGHYTTYAKNPVNDKWYYFDDSEVHHIPEKHLENELISKNAYILYYETN